jgi:serine/threonine-protein kinase
VGDQNNWAIVMELVERGETLGSLLEREGRLNPRRALSLARQIAAGLGHAHEMGIVHRDVKPANVLVIRRGDVEHAKVTDFGIARIVDEERRTRGDMTLGTLYYIAPEQTQSSTVDQTADVYSLGVTMYEALTGTLPFTYDSPGQMLQAHLAEAPLPPSKRAPDLPPPVDRLVLDCMSKRPHERPPGGNAVVARIDALLDAIDAGGTNPAIPKTRVMSSDDLTPVQVALPELAERRPRSFAISTNPDPARSGNNLALWIGVGVALLLVGVCLLGGLLSCVTCAR